MTRACPNRVSRTRVAIAAIATSLLACTPHPRLVAVADSAGVAVIYDEQLVPLDTVELDSAREAATGDVLFTGDGVSLLSVGTDAHGGGLRRSGRLARGILQTTHLSEAAHRIVPFSDGRRILVLGALSGGDALVGTARVIDVDSFGELSLPITACSGAAVDAAVHRDGAKAFVVCEDDSISEIDAILNQVVRNTSLSLDRDCGVAGAALSPSGSLLLVPCARSGWMLYIDRVSLTPLDSVQVGPGAHSVVVLPGTREAIVAFSREIVFVDLGSLRVRRRAQFATEIHQVESGADGRSIAILGTADGHARILLVDRASGALVREAAAPPRATSVAVWPGREFPVMIWQVRQ